MRKHLIVLLLLAACFRANGQGQTIHGNVADTLNHSKLQGAVITLISTADSTINTFTRADADGSFTLRPDTIGNFILLVSYPEYADFRDVITLKQGQQLQLGNVPMATKAKLLQEFVLHKKQSSIKINGDTTEYMADSFKVQDGATVDALLKKLPGIQVDRNGGITAQGEKVQKVLVDGEEFFSDDPAVVTQSLQARSVDAVQVYDKKSDATILTGIEDGQLQKTINLKLKDNMKKGFFGKAVAGGGTDGYFENQLMINAFKGKRQLSAFGIVSNTGKVGLGWGDRDKYGGGNNFSYDEESGNSYSYYSSEDDDLSGNWSGEYSGEGLPSVWTGGLHYANKWHEGKQHVSANYRYIKQNVDAVGSTFTQYILPDSQYFSNQRRESFSTGERHGADGLVDLKLDSNSTLQLTVSGDYIHNIKNSSSFTETLDGDGKSVNSSDRHQTNDATAKKTAGTLLYRRKFAKKGRNIFAQIKEDYKETDGTGFLLTDNKFTDAAIPDAQIDQRKTAHTKVLSLNGKASYTEPLSKVAFLNIGYSVDLSNNQSERLSYNRSGIGLEWSDAPDSINSSSYKYRVMTQSGNVALNIKLKKYNFTIGADVFHTDFSQDDQLRDTSFSRSYNNFSPRASFSWEIKKQTRLRISYQGSTRQPTLDQIQPLRQNTDPLNISIGNPNLKQSFSNSINLNYNSYQVLTGQYVYLGAYGSFVKDAISQTQFVNDTGIRTYQYINVNGNYNANAYMGMDHKFKKGDFNLGINGNVSINHTTNYINGLQNTSDNRTYSLGPRFEKNWSKGDKEVAGVELQPNVTYNDNNSSISTLATSYFNYAVDLQIHADLPWKLKVNTNVDANFRERVAEFDRNNNVVRWNAWIARKLLKGDVMEVRLSVFDILNQNIGYSRSAYDNYITENNYNTIRRYGMLSVIWNFSNSPANAKKDDDE